MIEQWETALHEAAHGVCAIALHGRCLGLALFPNGGQAVFDGLHGVHRAYATAAGRSGERLASRFPVPAEQPAELKPMTLDDAEQLPVGRSAPFLAAQLSRTVPKASDSDSRWLALWSVTGAEANPGSWASKVAHAHTMADRIIERHADAVVRVATALFCRGSLSESEILDCFEGV